jgi:hypothetical protein
LPSKLQLLEQLIQKNGVLPLENKHLKVCEKQPLTWQKVHEYIFCLVPFRKPTKATSAKQSNHGTELLMMISYLVSGLMLKDPVKKHTLEALDEFIRIWEKQHIPQFRPNDREICSKYLTILRAHIRCFAK